MSGGLWIRAQVVNVACSETAVGSPDSLRLECLNRKMGRSLDIAPTKLYVHQICRILY